MLVLVTPPDPIVTRDEAKKHLRIDHVDDDAYIDALVETATASIDGRDGWLGRALAPQTWDLRLDRNTVWQGSAVRLPLPPLISVEWIKYRDRDGGEQTYAAGNYRVSGVGTYGAVSLRSGAVWPAVDDGDDAVTIRFRAGYQAGDPPAAAVPAPIKHAILLMVGHLYSIGGENLFLRRETVEGVSSREWTVSETAGKILTAAAERLLAPYKVWSL